MEYLPLLFTGLNLTSATENNARLVAMNYLKNCLFLMACHKAAYCDHCYLIFILINHLIPWVTLKYPSACWRHSDLLPPYQSLGHWKKPSLNEDLLNVAKWLNKNKLTIINLDKTKCMLIGSKRRLGSIRTWSVSILDYKRDNVSNFKYLGFLFLKILRGPIILIF